MAGGDVDHVALAAELLDVLQQDRLCAFRAIVVLVSLGRPSAAVDGRIPGGPVSQPRAAGIAR